MRMMPGRRDALTTFALATGAIGFASAAAKPATAPVEPALTPPGATHLDALKKRLARAPRRRDFKSVPMILNRLEQWDHEALTEVLSYRSEPKQAWDGIDLGIPWLNLIRNTLNTQMWSFKRPDFLAVSVTHSTAHLALYDQAMWDKYQPRDDQGLLDAQRCGPEDQLGPKTRELIIAVAVRCDGCITVHAEAAARHGASREEIAEALGLATAVNAGAALVYSGRVLDAYQQTTAASCTADQ